MSLLVKFKDKNSFYFEAILKEVKGIIIQDFPLGMFDI